MPADIVVPWIDPLKLIDAYARIVLKPDVTGFMLVAQGPGPANIARVLLKGAARSEWMNVFVPPEQDTTSIVTFVPFRPDAAQQRMEWKPLFMAELRPWADQLALLHLDPLSDNLRTFAAMHRALHAIDGPLQATRADRHAYPTNYPAVSAARAHKVVFEQVLNALRHPSSAHLLGLASDTLGQILRPDTINEDLFYPMCALHSDGSLLRTGHTRNYGASSRHSWRRVQGHGLRPDTLFYGKRWIGDTAAPETLFAGVEMEMELQNSQQRQRMLTALFSSADELGPQRGQERLHVEQDGSIAGHGIEVVLMPHEIHSYHAETFWRKMWTTALAGGASNQQRTCGMHVHISAHSALHMPRGTDALWPGRYKAQPEHFQDTTGLLIDLVTAMLIGGPDLYAFELQPIRADHHDPTTMFIRSDTFGPRGTSLNGGSGRSNRYGGSSAEYETEQRFVTQAFGRPPRWAGDYAGTHLHLMRKRPNTHVNRYRHVNWNNQYTIEFRTFGPHDYDEQVEDWVNVATQMCSAIVHFSRAMALHVLRKGCQAADAGAGPTRVLALMPRWLQPILRMRDNRAQGTTPDRIIAAMGLPIIGGDLYALAQPTSGRGIAEPWLIGLPWVEARHEWGTYLYDPTWAGVDRGDTALRSSQLYGAMLLLWQRFREFLERQTPQYAILQAHLQQRVYPKLPTSEQQARMLHAQQRTVPPTDAAVTTDRRAVEATIAALRLETTPMTATNWTPWTDMSGDSTNVNPFTLGSTLNIRHRPQ